MVASNVSVPGAATGNTVSVLGTPQELAFLGREMGPRKFQENPCVFFFENSNLDKFGQIDGSL